MTDDGGTPRGFRVRELGWAHDMLRAGRILLDAAVFGLIAPLALSALFFILFEVLFLLDWFISWAAGALGAPTFAARINMFRAGTEMDRSIVRSLAELVAALAASAAAIAFIVGAARAGRIWAIVLLLAIAALLALIAPASSDAGTMSLTLQALGVGVSFLLPAVIALGAGLLLAGAITRLAAPLGVRVHSWPTFSIPLYVARFGLTRPSFWLALMGRIFVFALKALAMALAFAGVLFGGAVLAREALLAVGFAPELLQFYALLIGMNIVIFGAIAVMSLVSAFRDPPTRFADLAIVLVCALALWDMAWAVSFAMNLMRQTGTPFFASPISEEELEAINAIGMVWLFRGLMAGTFVTEYRKLRLQTARTARELAETRPEKPILFLRSFGDDEQLVASSDALLAHAFGAAQPVIRIEELVASVMFARGPLVALANPLARAAPIGAARDVVANENWQAHVLDYLAACQVVICFFGKTPNFLWEIDQILAGGKLAALIIVLPPDYPKDRTLFSHAPKLAALLGLTSEDDERKRLHNARVLVHDVRGQMFEVIRSGDNDSFAYREAIVQAAARLGANAATAR